jgi:hypothetical protein
MSLIFTSSNFITTLQQEASVKQYVYTYNANVQRLKIENARKIVIHLWGGGGGGGGSNSINTTVISAGAGGGGAFTILDFPYYPTRRDIFVEVIVGKGGNGGSYISNGNYVEAQNGGDTIVYFKDEKGRVLKEFISYGGKGGQGNGNKTDTSLKRGGAGGSNTLEPEYILMGASYEQGAEQRFPQGGNDIQSYGDHCQMNYLSVSGSGGGANFPTYGENHGGSFILNKGGLGGATGANVAGGGGSTYYGRGGAGGTSNSPIGGDGELNSGAGGGGSISIFTGNNTLTSRRLIGGNGANGMAVIEVYT